MKKKEIFLTSEGYLELENELHYLKTEKRKEVTQTLKEARALGDLSENSEYEQAREDQANLEKRIIEVCSKKKESKTIDFETHNLQVSITKMLHELGIPSHIKGYQFLRDAINIVFDRPDVIGGITKELYPELAGKYDTTVSRVERAIRHAIEVSWNRGSWDMMEELFGHSVDIDKAKPTNSEFIVTLADKLRMDFHRIAV